MLAIIQLSILSSMGKNKVKSSKWWKSRPFIELLIIFQRSSRNMKGKSVSGCHMSHNSVIC